MKSALNIPQLILQFVQQYKDSLDIDETQSYRIIYSHRTIAIDVAQLSITDINLERSICFWSAPEKGEYLAAYDICESFQAEGKQRLSQLDKQFKNCMTSWSIPKGFDSPIAFCGFAFDDNDQMDSPWQEFSNSQLIIPQLLVHIRAQATRIILNYTLKIDDMELYIKRLLKKAFTPTTIDQLNHQPLVQSAQQQSHKSDWIKQVNNALLTLKKGVVNKLVPSRHVRYQQQPVSADDLLNRLSKTYPACRIISMRQNKSRLIAASPERLLKISGENVSCDAIGGTLKRSHGQSISQLLRHNSQSIDKLLHEHAIIVEHIYNVLDQFCEILKLPTAPGIMKLKHLLHLETQLRGKLKKPTSILTLAEKLHPTPAVAGFPTQEAITWLKQNERHQRGWYTGAVGWMTPSGAGELSVVLRCALISQQKANQANNFDLYAGAGIVENSSPEEEWDETELKLETILGILK